MNDNSKPQLIKKAVFPVGGLGTRFLPATKATPKEMLPIVDKPLIQYAVEEAIEAGIDTLIFITGRNKRAIPDHFDKAFELEHELEAAGKTRRLKLVSEIIPPHVDCIYIRQSEALGLGHAVLQARKAVGNEPFAVLLADDLIDGGHLSGSFTTHPVSKDAGSYVTPGQHRLPAFVPQPYLTPMPSPRSSLADTAPRAGE